jgi:hypothetical protein
VGGISGPPGWAEDRVGSRIFAPSKLANRKVKPRRGEPAGLRGRLSRSETNATRATCHDHYGSGHQAFPLIAPSIGQASRSPGFPTQNEAQRKSPAGGWQEQRGEVREEHAYGATALLAAGIGFSPCIEDGRTTTSFPPCVDANRIEVEADSDEAAMEKAYRINIQDVGAGFDVLQDDRLVHRHRDRQAARDGSAQDH